MQHEKERLEGTALCPCFCLLWAGVSQTVIAEIGAGGRIVGPVALRAVGGISAARHDIGWGPAVVVVVIGVIVIVIGVIVAAVAQTRRETEGRPEAVTPETVMTTEIAVAMESTRRELAATTSIEALRELLAATASEIAAGRTRARTDARLSTAHPAAANHAAATDVHAAASHSAATAGVHATSHTSATPAAHLCGTTTATATATAVLGECRSGNRQTERQGCRAQNTEFRHRASPKK
jgi:hypothetical protein